MTEFTCQPHKRHHTLFGLIPCSTWSQDEVEIDDHLLRFDFRERRILEVRGVASAEIARLEPAYPGIDGIQRWQGAIRFPAHTLMFRRPLLLAPGGCLESQVSGVAKDFKYPWLSKQLHIEGIGSFENSIRNTVIGRCGEADRNVCTVVASFWATYLLANESIG